MKLTSDLLLPRIKRRNDAELEQFIITSVNTELEKAEENGEHCDLIQMQYFFESVFDDKEILAKLKKMS